MSDSPVAVERYRRLAALPLSGTTARRGASVWGVVAPIREIFRYREMLDLLVRRDLKARYKDSVLGFFWSMARPLMQLAIYFIVVGQFLQAAKGIPDFAVYIFSGLTAMGLFSEILLGATGSILIGTALDELERSGGRYGLVTMCAAGGMAPAIIIERI